MIYEEISAERRRQDDLFGHGDHDPFVYVAVLAEETGEVARAIHDARFGGNRGLLAARYELVQVAAVAVQMIERIDAGRMPWSA